ATAAPLLVGGAVDPVTVCGANGHRLEAGGALDDELHVLLHRAAPEARVELLVAVDLLAVDPDDHVALPHAGPARWAERRPPRGDEAPPLALDRVEAEPGPRPAARHPPLVHQLVLDGEELLDRDGEVDVGIVAQSQRGDPDDLPGGVDQGAAAE